MLDEHMFWFAILANLEGLCQYDVLDGCILGLRHFCADNVAWPLYTNSALVCLIMECAKMRYQTIAGTSLEVSRIALGCMTLSPEPPAAVATIRAALDLGINFFDHADVYGRGTSEEV